MSWSIVAGPPAAGVIIKHLAEMGGTLYGVGNSGTLYKWNGSSWELVIISALGGFLALETFGSELWAIATATSISNNLGYIYKWSAGSAVWSAGSGSNDFFSSIKVRDGVCYAIRRNALNSNALLWRFDGWGAPSNILYDTGDRLDSGNTNLLLPGSEGILFQRSGQTPLIYPSLSVAGLSPITVNSLSGILTSGIFDGSKYYVGNSSGELYTSSSLSDTFTKVTQFNGAITGMTVYGGKVYFAISDSL